MSEMADGGGRAARFRVEGRIDEANVGELLAASELALSEGKTVLLDLAGVTFVDAIGAEALRGLEGRGVALLGGSGFLRELLHARAADGAADSSEPLPDTALLQALRRGDETAFETLVRRYGPRMIAAARRILGSEAEARDAVQESFLAAFRGLGSFAGAARLSTWLHRIAVNAALMRLRRRRIRPEQAIDDLLPRFDANGDWAEPGAMWQPGAADEALEREETRLMVRRAIDRLPETYRTVLLCRDIEELDTDETAELLEITPNAVKVRLHRARQALRTLIELEFADRDPAIQRSFPPLPLPMPRLMSSVSFRLRSIA